MTLLLVSALALLAAGALWPGAAPACVAAAGALLTIAAARRDRFLLAAALGAFTARAGLAIVFHGIAALDLPSLRPLLEVEPGTVYRFWIVARDSLWYHTSAVESLLAWRQGTELPEGSDPQFFVFTALIYRLFGPDPLNAVLFNALFGALTVVAGHRIAARVAGAAAARATAVLVAFWPSAILWSTQLLKDAICLWLILVLLDLTMRAVDPPVPAEWTPWTVTRWIALLALVFAAALAVHRFRYYVLLILIPAPAVFIAHALIRRTRRTPWRIAATCVVMGVMVLAVSASRRIDLQHLFGSRYPEIGHVNLGVRDQAGGDLDGAQAHYERALALVRDHPPALKNLASVALARGDRARAIGYLQRYVAREPRDDEARVALAALVRPAADRPAVVEQPAPAPPPVASPSPVTPPVLVTAAPIPLPVERLAVTGPGSDHAMGKRGSEYRDPFAAIARLRRGFARTGGRSSIDGDVAFTSYRDALAYLPRGLAHVLLAPYPSQWFDRQGSTGPFKVLSAAEAMLLYVLIVPLLVGLGVMVVRGSADALYLAVFVATMMTLLGLVVSNVGTLFRLRLESLLPLFAAGGLGGAWLVRRWR